MLPLIMASLILMNTSGPVLFDGEALAYVNLNGTNAYIELPKLPGKHNVMYGEKEFIYHLFDITCSSKEKFSCNITAISELILDYEATCGSTIKGNLNLKPGEQRELLVDDVCNTAIIKFGDYEKDYVFTRVYRNFINLDGEVNLTIRDNGEIVLKKFGKDYVNFPELSPGEYTFKSGDFKGVLIIEPLKHAIYGYFLAAVLIISAISLLWLG
ncbi:MAG: hypothetical protein GOU98_03280 [Candidatus Altiarchaeota archaeon]|nr:hypothetical protein [Candidatus Altiarchaeota archaeon]